MALETARKFIVDLENDSTLAAQLYVASPDSLDGVVDFASGKGYLFTMDELEKALKLYPDSAISRQLRQYIR